MMKKLSTQVILGLTTIVVVYCGTAPSKTKPVLIQALFPQVVHQSNSALNQFISNGEGRSRPFYGSSGGNPQRTPERGQILHRPNKNQERSRNDYRNQNDYRNHNDYNGSPNMPQMSDGAPIILGGKGKSKNVKYISANGYQQQGSSNSNRAPPPQVYVISGGGDEEEDEGMLGSMQTYFTSIPRRIKEVVQGFMGTVD